MRDELKKTHGKNGIPELKAIDQDLISSAAIAEDMIDVDELERHAEDSQRPMPFYRPDLTPFEMAKEFSRLQGKVKKWMRENRETYRDECGDVNLTALVEGAAEEFEIDHEGGPLDDLDSWIWDLAVKVSEA
jgi:hypothetical protein